MARRPATDHEWLLSGPFKTRLFELWFSEAQRDAPAATERGLEREIGATGPNALRETLDRLVKLRLIEQRGDQYQPVPFAQLPSAHKEMRRALEAFLGVFRRL